MPVRMSSFFRRARAPAPPSAPAPGEVEVVEVLEEHPPPPSPSPVPPSPAELRRERRALAGRREVEMRDVGGLAVEMVRRDRFNPDLLVARADDVLLVEQRMHELDALLAAEISTRGLRNVPRCKCGAPLPPGVHFCSHCGRPARGSPAVVVCAHCGQALPAEANFCSFCGNAAGGEQPTEHGDDDPFARTLLRPDPGEERSPDPDR